MIQHIDEVLSRAIATDETPVPRFDIEDENGNIIYPNCRLKLKNPITQAGTPVNKPLLDEFLAASGVTAGTATAYTLAQAGFVLADGATVRFRLHTASGSNATLNVAGTGAKAIKTALGLPLRQGIAAGMWLTAVYSASHGAYIVPSAPAPVYEVISRTVIPAQNPDGDYPIIATIPLPSGYSAYRLTGMTDTGVIGGRIEVSNQAEAYAVTMDDRWSEYDYIFLPPRICYIDFAINEKYMFGTMNTGSLASARATSSAAITSVIFRAEYIESESVVVLEGYKT
jgi:hypothetical protein